MRPHACSPAGALFVCVLMGLCLTLTSPSQAQPKSSPPAETQTKPIQGRFLGLKQAIELALEQHPLLQVADANLKAAEARTKQTESLYFPQVYADFATAAGVGGINPRFVTPAGSMLRKNLSQYTGGVIANQRLYDFGFTSDLVETSDLAARAQAQDVTAQRALVLLNVQRAYLTSLKQRQLVQIAEETVRERGIIKSQVEKLYRQQLKAKLDLDLVQVELTNAESSLVKARNQLKAGFAQLNRAMGIAGPDDYVLEDIPVEVQPRATLEQHIQDSLSHPELRRAKELARSAEARLRATKKQYLPTVNAIASAGDYEVFDTDRGERTGGWWAASAVVSVPLFTGGLIDNQVREATAQQAAAQASTVQIEQALTQQVTNAYLDTLTFAQQIKLTEELVVTAQDALRLAQQRYKLGLSSIVEVTQSQVAVTSSKTKLAEARYDYKIAEVTLAYTASLPVGLE